MEWKDVLEYVLKTLCVIIITYGIPTLLSALKKQTDNEYAHKAIDFAGTVIADCVKATNQTFVETLKKEGKFDAEAAKTAFILCKDEVLKILNERTKQAIIDSCGDLETWIKAKIESEVREQKAFGNILTVD